MAHKFFCIFRQLVLLLSLTQLSISAVAQDEQTAKLIKSKNPKDNVKQLEFESDELEVKMGERLGEAVPLATVKGSLDKEGWSLLYNDEPIVSADGDREFEYDFPLSARLTTFSLKVQNTKGQKKTIRFGIKFDGYSEMTSGKKSKRKKSAPKKEKSEAEPSVRSKPLQFNGGLGLSIINYTEENTGATVGDAELSMMALTLKAGASYAFNDTWDTGVGGYFTLLALSSTLTSNLPSVNEATDSAKFFGINLRVGYRLGFVKAPSSLKLMLGWYITSMIVTNESFGFTNMAGPQIYPVFNTKVSARNSITLYAKFSTIIGALSLDNREIAGGGSFNLGLSNGNTLSFTLDVANIGFVLTQDSATSTVSSTSFSGGVSYGF